MLYVVRSILAHADGMFQAECICNPMLCFLSPFLCILCFLKLFAETEKGVNTLYPKEIISFNYSNKDLKGYF